MWNFEIRYLLWLLNIASPSVFLSGSRLAHLFPTDGLPFIPSPSHQKSQIPQKVFLNMSFWLIRAPHFSQTIFSEGSRLSFIVSMGDGQTMLASSVTHANTPHAYTNLQACEAAWHDRTKFPSTRNSSEVKRQLMWHKMSAVHEARSHTAHTAILLLETH